METVWLSFLCFAWSGLYCFYVMYSISMATWLKPWPSLFLFYSHRLCIIWNIDSNILKKEYVQFELISLIIE